jgi:hypothetical protein
MRSLAQPLLTLVTLALSANAASSSSTVNPQWILADAYIGRDFLTKFEFEAIPDPTHGRVYVTSASHHRYPGVDLSCHRNYVDQATALQKGLASATTNSFQIRCDATTTLTPSDPGRDSVRVRSRKQYDNHVVVANVRHMPQGLGTWPALWETQEDGWPGNGEVTFCHLLFEVEYLILSPVFALLRWILSKACMISLQTRQRCILLPIAPCRRLGPKRVRLNLTTAFGSQITTPAVAWQWPSPTPTVLRLMPMAAGTT